MVDTWLGCLFLELEDLSCSSTYKTIGSKRSEIRDTLRGRRSPRRLMVIPPPPQSQRRFGAVTLTLENTIILLTLS
jgi:hypothetical protein